MKTGTELIAQERERQITQEGWTPEHDDTHKWGEMKEAAVMYARYGAEPRFRHSVPMGFPWAAEWWKPSEDPIRNLVKAGALIAAEIDRLTRLTPKCKTCGDLLHSNDNSECLTCATYRDGGILPATQP